MTGSAVALLARALEEGRESLEYSDEHGWLPSLLEKLQISRTHAELLREFLAEVSGEKN